MRILLVTSWFLSLNRPYFSPYLDEFVRHLATDGVDVSVYAPRPPKETDFSGQGRVRTHNAITPLGFARFIVELLTTHDAIVHVQRPNTYASIFIVAARLLSKPVVVTIHRAEVLPYHPLPWRILRGFVLRVISEAICVSGSTRELAIGLGCPPGRSIIVYNTVDQHRFSPNPPEPARVSLGLPVDENILLYVGDLKPEKRCDDLLRAFAGVGGECHLLILGDGPLRRELESLATALGIREKVSFIGRLPHSSKLLPIYYNASDIFVLASITEGHSLALLEALASGLPIVATSVGGNVETIDDGRNGILVNPGDVSGLQKALESLLNDVGLRARMRVAARDSSLLKFSGDEQVERIVRVYRSFIPAS